MFANFCILDISSSGSVGFGLQGISIVPWGHSHGFVVGDNCVWVFSLHPPIGSGPSLGETSPGVWDFSQQHFLHGSGSSSYLQHSGFEPITVQFGSPLQHSPLFNAFGSSHPLSSLLPLSSIQHGQ